MENGVTKVEEVKLKVDESDNDVLGGGMKGIGIDDAVEEANGDDESVSATVEAEETLIEDENNENGGDLSDSIELDGTVDAVQTIADTFEDAIEPQTVIQNAHIDPVEEFISTKVIEKNELLNSDEHEAKEVNLEEVAEEISESSTPFTDRPSEIEANEPEVGESTSDNDLEAEVSLIEGKDEVERVDVTDASRDEPNVLENKSHHLDNGVDEVTKVSGTDDNESEDIQIENPVSVILQNPENGVSENADLGEPIIHQDCINGNSATHTTQPDGELVVETNGDVLHENINQEEILLQDEDNDTTNHKEKVESSTNNSPNTQNEPKAQETQEEDKNLQKVPNNKPETSKFENPEPNDYIVKQSIPLKKEPESKPIPHPTQPKEKIESSTNIISNMQKEPDNKPETPKFEKTEPNVKPSIPLKKEPELKPIPQPTNPTQTRPAGLGTGAPLLEHAHRVVPNGNSTPPIQNQVIDEPTTDLEEPDETREKLQMIRVKFLRLARRLGQTPHNVVVAQVLYRLGLAEQLRGRTGGRVAAFSFERASAMAEQLESTGQEPLEFSCTIMVLGKTGVGKSATINSIFDEVKFDTNAFQLGTKKVQDVVGTVQGIKVRVIDTPGLLPSWNDQRKNEKILQSVKKFIQKSPPDIVLYLDRLDMQSRDFGDMPLLRTITDIFGQSIWFNAIVVLTHAASAPPEGPNGTTTSYDMFVTQRSHVVQQAIRQAAGDMRLMNPVSLVENHSACRTNRAGQRVLPNGQVWKPHLLLLSFASKILVEANMLLKLQDSPPGKPFGPRSRAPPLPFILSTLLQSRPQLKLPNEQFDDDVDDDDDDDDVDDDELSEYDSLPAFKRLSNAQLAKLSKVQKKAYYDELEYREKLFMKKQLKEEKLRRKMMRKMAEEARNVPEVEDETGSATVPVAVQDMNLPVSFDADNPAHRYRALDSANQWLIRPVLDPHGWDHDVGYEGINIEHLLALKEKIPVSFSGQITKDKKDANLQLEISTGIKHGKQKSKSTTLSFDTQTVGKDMSYTLRSETRFLNFKKNKASVGFSGTHFGDALTGGVKFEDKVVVGRRGEVVVAGGAVMGRGDVAYGGSIEGTLRDKEYPLGRFLTTGGVSVMDWHGDVAVGWNGQTQIPIGRFTNLIGRVNLNNKGSGQVSVRLNSSEQLQIALVAFVPLICKLVGLYQDRDTSY